MKEMERLEEEVKDSRVLIAILLDRLGGEASISFLEFDEMKISGAGISLTMNEYFGGYHYRLERPAHE